MEATIYLSGLGFENGGLAAAHAVNDGFAQEPQAHGMYHGEKVAFGTLVQLVLEKAPQEELEQVLAFLRDTGLPLTLAQLGVKGDRARDPEKGGGGRRGAHPVHQEPARRYHRPGGLRRHPGGRPHRPGLSGPLSPVLKSKE